MPTNRQFVSDILDNTKSLTLDDRISKRWVLSTAFDKAAIVIKQDSDARRLFNITSVWRTLPCVEMEKVDSMACGDIPHCKFLMKSKLRIPEVWESSYGDIIKIMTVDTGKEYSQTTSFGYKDIISREYKDSGQRYFWIINRYIYIPDSEVKILTAIGLFKKEKDVKSFNGEDDGCTSPLDFEFPCPAYLLGVVKDQVEEEIVKIYKPLVTDDSPDDNTNSKR